MISTKNLVSSYKNVPSAWAMWYYAKLPEQLTGQEIKICSVFNPKDKTPSMNFFYSGNGYRYKCFSTGKSGAPIDLVKELFNLPFPDAADKMIADYNQYLQDGNAYEVTELKKQSKYKVTSYKIRGWDTGDKAFWTKFNIGSVLLEYYNVRALEWYIMTKEGSEIKIQGPRLYGYFKADGTLYKIYQPDTRDRKFIKVNDYLQGWEQLQGYDNLIITSSLKDILSIASLKMKVDLLAPDSENTMLSKKVIEDLKDKYKFIHVCMDHDPAGHAAMEKYRDIYGFRPLLLALSKDPSDSVRDHGPKKVLYYMVPLLQSA